MSVAIVNKAKYRDLEVTIEVAASPSLEVSTEESDQVAYLVHTALRNLEDEIADLLYLEENV